LKVGEDGLMEVDVTTNHAAIWVAMESLVEKGLTKSIGVSNFSKDQVARLLKNCKIRPATNQIEHHVYLQQRDLVDFCQSEKVTVTAYSPLGSKGIAKFNAGAGIVRDLPDLMDIPEVKEIAAAHGKSPAQVLLRWIIDTGVAAIPKSTNPDRLKQNLDVFDFELTAEEVAKLSSLDKNIRVCDFAFFHGYEYETLLYWLYFKPYHIFLQCGKTSGVHLQESVHQLISITLLKSVKNKDIFL